MLWIAALATLTGSILRAQDVSGDWQGTLKDPSHELPDRRVIVHMEKSGSGTWNTTLFRIDVSPNAIRGSSVVLHDSTVKFTFDPVKGSYEGKLNAYGTSLSGTWTQRRPWPLELRRATKETAWSTDPSPHTVQFITVDRDVKLEVVDWGGDGRPLVLVAGYGNDAHVFDQFAPKLVDVCHVYGITRRGFGASDAPASGYSVDRLADDLLSVVDTLQLTGPVGWRDTPLLATS
jgi:non-heme chloroperoxidase